MTYSSSSVGTFFECSRTGLLLISCLQTFDHRARGHPYKSTDFVISVLDLCDIIQVFERSTALSSCSLVANAGSFALIVTGSGEKPGSRTHRNARPVSSLAMSQPAKSTPMCVLIGAIMLAKTNANVVESSPLEILCGDWCVDFFCIICRYEELCLSRDRSPVLLICPWH